MNNRPKDNQHISAMRCDRTLNYLEKLRKANCSSTFFQEDKCKAALIKMDEVAELCVKKYS
tara:strand:+ start:1483 stop:1665 length:183 start_codon:yes stop_codon:yes gene_type:complete